MCKRETSTYPQLRGQPDTQSYAPISDFFNLLEKTNSFIATMWLFIRPSHNDCSFFHFMLGQINKKDLHV